MAESYPQPSHANTCPPVIKGHVAFLENMLENIPDQTHAFATSTLVNKLVSTGDAESIAQVETWFREMGGSMYLLAAPLEALDPQDVQNVRMCVPSDGEPSYVLYAVRGAEQAAGMREQLGVSEQENLSRLKHTGILHEPTPPAE